MSDLSGSRERRKRMSEKGESMKNIMWRQWPLILITAHVNNAPSCSPVTSKNKGQISSAENI